jgi:hypothetical protein
MKIINLNLYKLNKNRINVCHQIFIIIFVNGEHDYFQIEKIIYFKLFLSRLHKNRLEYLQYHFECLCYNYNIFKNLIG